MADINFDCPHCGHNLDVNERGAGLTVACPECSKTIVIPMPAPEVTVSNIIFNCGSCGQPLKAAPDMAGQLIDCPVCKKPTEIPLPSRPTPSSPTRPAARSTPIRKPPSPRNVPRFVPLDDTLTHVTVQSSGGACGLGFGWFLIAVGIASIIGGLIFNPRYTAQAKMFKEKFSECWDCEDRAASDEYRQITEKARHTYFMELSRARMKAKLTIVLAFSGGFVIALGGWLITRKKA